MIAALLQLLYRAWVYDTPTCHVRHASEGQILDAFVTPAPERHAWHVLLSFEWLPNDKQPSWVADIQPGFVEHSCPIVATTVGNAPRQTLWREQVTKTQGVDLNDPKASIDVPLYDHPQITLGWRPIGRDGDSGDAVPKFFKELGVGDPPKAVSEDSIGQPQNLADQTVSPGNRLLRACSLVLYKPRVALTAQTDVGNPLVDSVSVTQTLGLKAPSPNQKLKIAALSKYDPTADVGIQPWAMDYQEQTWDDKLIATLYLLSPMDAPLGSDPNGSWTPYVAHNVFWSMDWAQPLAPDAPVQQPLTLIVPLAGGVAQPIVNMLLANVNDSYNQLSNMLAANSMAGRFWTI